MVKLGTSDDTTVAVMVVVICLADHAVLLSSSPRACPGDAFILFVLSWRISLLSFLLCRLEKHDDVSSTIVRKNESTEARVGRLLFSFLRSVLNSFCRISNRFFTVEETSLVSGDLTSSCKAAVLLSSGDFGFLQLGLMPFRSPCVARAGGPFHLLPCQSAEGKAVTVAEDIAKVRISSCSSNSGKDEEQEHPQKEWNLCNIGDDCLSAVLSFLSPSEIVACAGVCRRLRLFCKDDHKLWLPMCERRWGAHTSVQKWGRGKVLFKGLHSILIKLENLVGFWRGVGHGGHGSLVTFEWGSHYVIGYRVTPSRPSCYEVCQVPFVLIGVSDNGSQVCLYDPDRTITPFFCEGMCSSHDHLKKTSPVNPRRINPFSELDPDWDLEHQTLPAGLLTVDLHFVGKLHIVMEESQQPQFFGNRSLAEAAVVASFASRGGSIADATSLSPSSSGSSSEIDSHGQSPPGSFQYEMYQFLASKVTSKGGERIARKQRRRERERALLGRRVCEAEHFVKVRDVVPTRARPLQGLWKGICDSQGLEFVLLSYDDNGGIMCRRVGECMGTTHSGSVCWRAESDSLVRAPLSVHEQCSFHKRQHFAPTGVNGKCFVQDGCDEEVVGMLCTLPITGLDVRAARSDAENTEGRVWQYASGRFGFGFLPTNFVIDFRPICSTIGLLLDVLK